MQSLVIGGGFLGAHVAERLAARGDKVVVYSRSFNPWLIGEDRSGIGTIELKEGVLPTGSGLQELIAESEVVYYLAGSGTPLGANVDPGGSIVSSVVPAAAVLDLMRGTHTKRIVVASSGGTVYGPEAKLPTDEGQPTRPISIHGHNSLSIERYALFFAEQYGLEPAILRYSNPYGPGQLVRRGQGVIAAWCDALAHQRPIVAYGSIDTRRDFVYVDDAAHATICAAEQAPAPGIYNVGSGKSYPLAEVIEIIEAVAGDRAVVEHVAARGVDIPRTHLDCSLLRGSTSWSPTVTIEEGIKATWKWVAGQSYPRRP